MFNARKCRLAAALTLGMMTAGGACAVDMQELVKETQQLRDVDQKMELVWWIPQEFWEASLAGNPNVSAESRAQFLSVLQDYQIIAVVYVKTGLEGFTELATEADILGNIRFESGGRQFAPVLSAGISPGAQAILAAIKPLVTGMLGQLGQSMHFVVYPSRDGSTRLVDPLRAGAFEVSLFEQVFHWRLPLASLLPKKIDPKTHEEFPGNFDFNPYTGGKLSAR
jgi:hypothetical protein